jgi:hypothetical protein
MGEEGSEFTAALFQVGGVHCAHLLHAARNNSFGDHLVSFSFPMGLVREVAVASEVIVELLQVLQSYCN